MSRSSSIKHYYIAMISPKIKLNRIKVVRSEEGERHSYKIGEKLVPGVTTITGVLDKPFLRAWGINCAIDTIREGLAIPRVMAEGAGVVNLEELYAKAKNASKVIGDTAKENGTKAHDWITKWICGGIPPAIDSQEAQNAVLAFLRWEREAKPEWLLSEETLGSAKHEFAGTIDAVALLNGKLSLIDFKTSKQLSEENWLQTAGYYLMFDENLAKGQRRPVQRVIVRIPKDGKDCEVVIKENSLDFEIEIFLHLRAVQRWMSGKPKQKYEKVEVKETK